MKITILLLLLLLSLLLLLLLSSRTLGLLQDVDTKQRGT